MLRFPLAAALLLLAPAALAADEPGTQQLLSEHGWTAVTYQDKGAKVCYLVGTPDKTEPAKLKRGRIDLYVTQRPHEKSFNVVHFDAGYIYKQGSSADLAVDGHPFILFTNKDSAWSVDSQTDGAITAALARGKVAVLKGTSAHDAATTDTYALEGFTEALDAIDKACGVKR